MIRILFLLLLGFCFSSIANAADWCRWDGSKGYGCVNDRYGYIRIDSGLPVGGGPENYNDNGYYLLVVTQPTIAEDYKKDTEVWDFVDDEITLTWTTIAMTAEEITSRTARTLDLQIYHVLKWLATPGAIDTTNGNIDPSTAPTALKDAFLARQAME